MRKVLNILIPVAICFALGFAGSSFQKEALADWYPTLVKPALIPPNWVFPIAWSILYVCMGVSAGLLLNMKQASIQRRQLLIIFAVQLTFNFLWSICFFYFQSPIAGLIDILLLDAVAVIYTIMAYKVNRPASYLFFPYLAWLGFATYLNLFILINN